MIPHAATTIRVERPANAVAGEIDPYEQKVAPAVLVARAVRAVISSPSGRDERTGANHPRIDARLLADSVALRDNDVVIDDSTGRRYLVAWVEQRVASFSPELQHTLAGLTHA